ncbi:MAG: DUF3025 domain-containing protein [Limnohabitans sp.]
MSAYPPDWSRPWWRDWRAWVEPVWSEWHHQLAQQAPDTSCLPDVLNRVDPSSPVRFVPQAALPPGQSYEHFIFTQRQVPTRDNLHDLFNACCWRRFPRTKSRLNALQADVIGREGVGAKRGPLRDALTLFDENALLLQAPPGLWAVLRAHDWHTLLVTHSPDWWAAGLARTSAPTGSRAVPVAGGASGEAVPGLLRPVVFGHALLEKLCQPYKSITAHAFWIDPQLPATDIAWDAWLAERLDASFMASKPFQPLPVMGIPGWCEGNADPAFYADVEVFRPVSVRAHHPR